MHSRILPPELPPLVDEEILAQEVWGLPVQRPGYVLLADEIFEDDAGELVLCRATSSFSRDRFARTHELEWPSGTLKYSLHNSHSRRIYPEELDDDVLADSVSRGLKKEHIEEIVHNVCWAWKGRAYYRAGKGITPHLGSFSSSMNTFYTISGKKSGRFASLQLKNYTKKGLSKRPGICLSVSSLRFSRMDERDYYPSQLARRKPEQERLAETLQALGMIAALVDH